MPPPDPPCWVFLSHIHEDEPVALWLKRRLERDFHGQVGVFVSSEAPAGAQWFQNLQEHLKKSAFLFALCSPESVVRPWVHFEVGAAWALGTDVIPFATAARTAVISTNRSAAGSASTSPNRGAWPNCMRGSWRS